MSDELERLTHTLTRPETAAAAAAALAGDCRRAAVEGLVELLGGEHSSRAGAAAVAALEGCAGPLVRGLRAYLRYRWSGRVPAPAEVPEAEDPGRTCPFWDWDEAVLARNLERLDEEGRRAALDVMPSLVGHPAERVSALAVEAL